MTLRIVALAVLALLPCLDPAAAVTVDGQLGADYGTALSTQTTQTGMSNGQITGDSNLGDLNLANGSELDAAYATVSGGVLDLFFSGNVAMVLNSNQNNVIAEVLDVFVDSQAGGQNSLNGLGSGNPLNGLTFDAGFEPDFWLEFNGIFTGGGPTPSYAWSASFGTLSTQGGGTLTYLGSGLAGGPGTLSGGTNPYGILATIDNRNTGGVTFGCNAASGAGVTTGAEFAIPLAAIGNPSGCFKLAALIRRPGTISGAVSNQVLGPLPPGTCPPGNASTLNFANFAGDQFFSFCPSSTGVPPPAASRLVLLGVGPNPARGDRLRVDFALADLRPATVQVADCSGRLVRERTVSPASGGTGSVDLSEGRSLAPGVYWVRLTQGNNSVARKICILQ